MKNELDQTMQFRWGKDDGNTVQSILMEVYAALQERGYDPISQLVGYIISGDPTYITSHKNARSLIRRLERDELLEEMVRFYLVHLDEQMEGSRH